MKIIVLSLMLLPWTVFAAEVSFTVDDPEVSESPLLSIDERNKMILQAFEKHKVRGALFVCGMRINI